MDKELLKAELREELEKELDDLLSELNDEDDFVEFEQQLIRHVKRQAKKTTELVQKHKSFSP
jgi:predicted lipid-binding transport protein (Tim44 family)